MIRNPQPWTLVHGASWLTPGGDIHIVPGFHEEWIRDHPDLVGACKTVNDVVLGLAWISVAVYTEGYVEFLVPRREDPEVLGRVEGFLARNRAMWRQVLLMSMEEEGYTTITPADLDAEGHFTPAFRASLALSLGS